MSADASSAFSCLPLAVRDSLLQQAFQQLDQRHLFGVAPRVCRLWHQLSLSIITSLDVNITSEAAAEQLRLWMMNRGAAGLNSLLLGLDFAVCRTPASSSLLQSLGAATQLRSLDVSGGYLLAVLDVPLPLLTNLTSLSLIHCRLPPAVVSSILSLSSLNSLSLHVIGDDPRGIWSTTVEQMATRLVGLTSLTLGVSVSNECLAHLRGLPHLKRLSVAVGVGRASSLRHLNGLPVTSIYIDFEQGTLGDAATWLHSAASGLEHLTLHTSWSPMLLTSSLPLYKAVHLQSLELARVKPDLTQLAALTQLTKLSLWKCDMHDDDVCGLSTLTGLQNLELDCNPGITGAQGSMEVLARSMPQLDSLSLLSTGAQDAAQLAFQGQHLLLKLKSEAFMLES